MTENNRLEWLIRTNTRYSGDPLYVERYEEKKTYHVDSMYELVERSNNIIKKLLQIIAYGDDLISKEIEINDANRKMIYDLLMPIYTNMVKDKKRKTANGN